MSLPDPIYLIGILVFLGLAPFVAIMVTSYVKIVVVLSLIRNALGIQQIPPNMVINGLSIILSLYIMNPVAQETYEILRDRWDTIDPKDIKSIELAANEAKIPLKEFLLKHANQRERQFFYQSAKKLWPEDRSKDLKDDDMMVLVPAFTVSELTEAFQIGFLIYLPFIAIDIIVSNILLSMGMMMVSPMTISLPFKLLLFVVVNGWARLIHGVLLTYS
ncbi:EscR/YscR/HrcR family type III secretion system export apparatus protein [bacterium]|nr:EscR/YscR/HrcR family type III secretion system export apparatus protein [bacterium]